MTTLYTILMIARETHLIVKLLYNCICFYYFSGKYKKRDREVEGKREREGNRESKCERGAVERKKERGREGWRGREK